MACVWHDWTANLSRKKQIYTVFWTLVCISIIQILGQIYSVVNADLYTIHEKILTLVELYRIQKKCSVKNNKIKRLGNLNFCSF